MAADTYDQSTLERLRDAALSLLPPGRAFSRRLGSMVAKVTEALVMELARAHLEASTVLSHISPRRARREDYLTAWEEAAEVPSLGSAVERAQRVADKIRQKVGRTRADFQAAAQALGYVVIGPPEAQVPFRAGAGRAGSALFGDAWSFSLLIPVSGSSANLALLDAAFAKLARAHTIVKARLASLLNQVIDGSGNYVIDGSGNRVVA